MVRWTDYLAPWIPNLIHVSPQTFMYGVGIIEICAGILVGLWPQYFAYAATLWLWGIILNLLTTGEYYDVALRTLVSRLARFLWRAWHTRTNWNATDNSRLRRSSPSRSVNSSVVDASLG